MTPPQSLRKSQCSVESRGFPPCAPVFAHKESCEEGVDNTGPQLLCFAAPEVRSLFNVELFLQVDWTSEKECFQTFAKECSLFYAFKPDPFTAEETNENAQDKNWAWSVEHVLFPAFRSGLVPPKHLAEDGTFLQVANLPDLYKVFERC